MASIFKFSLIVCLVILSLCFGFGESARVLGLFPTVAESHLIIQMEVIKTLVDRGHDVTVVTTIPLSEASPKYRHIKLPEAHFPKGMMNKFIEQDQGMLAAIKVTREAMSLQLDVSEKILMDLKKTTIMNESFDLVVFGIFLNEFFMGVAGHFKCPLVVIDTHKPFILTNAMVGNPNEIFYVPTGMSADNQPMSFFGRVWNLLLHIFEIVFTKAYLSEVREIYDKHFPHDKYPSFDDMMKNVSLILHTSHFSEGIIRPEVPAFIQIGGIQVKPKPNPLPQDIAQALDRSSEHGAIFFSLGTNALSSERDPETMKNIFNVLSTLKQTVLWKWENDQYPGNAANIIFKKWLPQDDILAHPNMKLFISHCGLGSVVESKYHGVPVVAIPLYGDQFGSTRALVDEGFAVSVDYLQLTEGSFRAAINEALQNGSYHKNIQGFSKLYRDRPMTTRDTTAFWLEYVIRHRGAKHMQSPAVHMTWIEYYGVDVFGLFFVIFYLLYKFTKICLRLVCRMCRRKHYVQKSKSKKE